MAPKGERWVCGCALLLGIALAAAHGIAFVASLDAADVPLALAGLLLGGLAMDGLTGLVHWACDTWGDERTPLFGPGLIYAFREHHRDPRAMLGGGWTHVNREPGIAAAVALVLLSLPVAQRALEGQTFPYAVLWSFVVYGGTANQLHLWAHMERPPRLVRLAQRCGLVLSPERHARHHRAPNTRAYCIATGWLNPLLDGVGFWRMLESTLSTLTGAHARRAGSAHRRLTHT